MAHIVEFLGVKPHFSFPVKTVQQIAASYSALRQTKLTNLSTERAYFFSGFLAKLEQVLVSYTTAFLKQRGFQLISVPDILHPSVLESCGMLKPGEHGMVYHLDEKRHGKLVLSGTSEMGVGAFWKNKQVSAAKLPVRLSAMSRCYRAEISDVQEGLYRVHEFTKVEMFGICRPDQSEALLQEFLGIQKDIVSSLGIYAQVMDMPEEDLGLAAHRKYDIEAWMPGQGRFGEISSTSNCTDFQSSRLNITYADSDADGPQLPNFKGNARYVHTVNGTACAVPRMIITLLEQNQLEDGTVVLPDILRRHFQNSDIAPRPENAAVLKWRKKRKYS